ncbi:MAG: type I secretion system permease/ATPase, partial [Oceanidesulfovibrio sp.]
MRRFLLKWKNYFIFAGLFSFFCSMLQLTFAVYMLLIYDRVLSSYSLPTLVTITVMASAALVVMVLLDIARSRLLVRLGIELDRTLSKDVFTQMIKSSALRTQGGAPANLKDVNTLRNYLSGQSIFFLFDLPWTPISLAIIYLLHPWLGYVAVGGGILIFILGFLTDRLSRLHLEKANLVANQSGELVSMSLRNAEAVRSMGMMDNVSARWSKLNNMVMNLQTEASHRAGILHSTTKGLRLFLQVAIYGVGAYLTLEGQSTPGVMITASIIMGKALGPVEQAMGTFRQSVDAWSSYSRLNMQFAMPDLPKPMDLPKPTGRINCEAASFQRDGKVMLYNVNFGLEAGDSVGIIGPSAAGKSTLCRLLVGIWPATGGKVRLDGADIYAWDQEKLGSYIGYLPQDVELFSGTVA